MLSTLHRLLSVGLVFVALAGVMYAVIRLRTGDAGDRLLRLSRWTAAALVIDGAAGLGAELSGQRPHEAIHVLVGALALLALPAALTLARRSGGRARAWWVFLGWLLLLGLCLRAVGTGAAVQ